MTSLEVLNYVRTSLIGPCANIPWMFLFFSTEYIVRATSLQQTGADGVAGRKKITSMRGDDGANPTSGRTRTEIRLTQQYLTSSTNRIPLSSAMDRYMIPLDEKSFLRYNEKNYYLEA